MMKILTNILSKLRGVENKVGTERLISYGVILILLITTFSKCGKSAKVEDCPDVEELTSYIADSLLQTIVIESNTEFDRSPKGDTVIVERVQYRDHTTFVKNWNELQAIKRKHEELSERHNSVVQELEKLKSQEDEINENGTEVWTFTEIEELPVVETDKSIKGKNYEIKETIRSKGQLVDYYRDITVHPEIVTITKTETEYLKKNNFLALKYGALYIDNLKNVKHVPSIEYGHKWFVLEAEAVLDQEYNFEGLGAKAGIVIKFK